MGAAISPAPTHEDPPERQVVAAAQSGGATDALGGQRGEQQRLRQECNAGLERAIQIIA